VDNEVTAYNRPSVDAQIFSSLSPGFRVVAQRRTEAGWYGFDPGVAQAANIGVFRLRWVETGADMHVEGDCAGLPVVQGPTPGICYTMPMGDLDVLASPDASSSVVVTMEVEDYAQVLGKTADDAWAQVDLSGGNLGLSQTGWIPAATLNMNGPCNSLPVVTP
jgi:hypothetical protein